MLEYIPKTFYDFDFNKHFGVVSGENDDLVTYHLCNTLFCPHCHSIFNMNHDMVIVDRIGKDDNSNYFNIYKCLMMRHTSSHARCPNCDTHGLVPVDSMMAFVIRKFNKRGWKTSECCSGHPYVDDNGKIYCSPTFVSFDFDGDPKNLKNEVQQLMAANEKPAIGIDGFHIFMIVSKNPCDLVTTYNLCVYINDKLPKTSISMDYPCPLCDRVQFNHHLYSNLKVGTRWDKKSSYQVAINTIEERVNGLIGITTYIGDRTSK